MNRKVILLAVAGFVGLTLLLILIRIAVRPRDQTMERSTVSPLTWRAQKSDLSEPDPLVDIPKPLTMGEVAPFETKRKDIVRSLNPLPVFPEERTVVPPEGTEPEGGILKNLYKESNRYYIPPESSAPGTAGTPGRQRYDSGLKE